MRFSFLLLILAAILTVNVGCDQPTSTAEKVEAGAHDHDHDGDDHGHSHDGEGHDHADHEGHQSHEADHHVEEMGPNKGHIVYLSPKDYFSEWRHYNGNSVIRVYVLDKDKNSVAVNAKVSIEPQTGKTRDPFVLQPEDAGEDGKTAVYMLDDDKLSVAMNLGVKLKIEIDGKTYEGEIPPHKPHHH